MTTPPIGGHLQILGRTLTGQLVTVGIPSPEEIALCTCCTLPDCRPNSVTCPDGALRWAQRSERRVMRAAVRTTLAGKEPRTYEH